MLAHQVASERLVRAPRAPGVDPFPAVAIPRIAVVDELATGPVLCRLARALGVAALVERFDIEPYSDFSAK